jgi:hypothetical protein
VRREIGSLDSGEELPFGSDDQSHIDVVVLKQRSNIFQPTLWSTRFTDMG